MTRCLHGSSSTSTGRSKQIRHSSKMWPAHLPAAPASIGVRASGPGVSERRLRSTPPPPGPSCTSGTRASRRWGCRDWRTRPRTKSMPRVRHPPHHMASCRMVRQRTHVLRVASQRSLKNTHKTRVDGRTRQSIPTQGRAWYSGCSLRISLKNAFLYLPYGRTPPWVCLSHVLKGIRLRGRDRAPITQLQ